MVLRYVVFFIVIRDVKLGAELKKVGLKKDRGERFTVTDGSGFNW
jgi:hypothetical protein